jgi:hypothetical protein
VNPENPYSPSQVPLNENPSPFSARVEIVRQLGIRAILAIFIISLALPAVFFKNFMDEGDNETLIGLQMLVLSISSLICLFNAPNVTLSFFANLLLILGWRYLIVRKYLLAMYCGLFSLLCALVTTFGAMVPKYVSYSDLYAGFYLWIASILLLSLIGGIMALTKQHTEIELEANKTEIG